jgi:chromosome segregation ATPase
MHTNPFTGTGYDLRALETKIDRKADQHEVASIRGDVGNLERSLGEVRTERDELRNRVERLEEIVRELNPGANL